MQLLTAKPVAEKLQQSVKGRVATFRSKHGRPPKLVVVLVGNDPASEIYTRKKGETAAAWGMDHETHRFSEDVSPSQIREFIELLNENPAVDGILIQRPLPSSFNEQEVSYWVSPQKDVDAFHPENVGRLVLGLETLASCTPVGVMRILDHYGISVSGKSVCIVGRSSIVGKPMAALVLNASGTVIHTHSKTIDLKNFTSQSDIVIVAIGKPQYLDYTYFKKGAVVVDVGINRVAPGKITGDVNSVGLHNTVSAYTPVPGGVGPMTIAQLMENTVLAAELRAKADTR